jgi:murein DD-endopeptidase MepM/ murein hydrolase activator NlpD
MKIKLTEQQLIYLAKNLKEDVTAPQGGDIDFEKEAPNLTKFIKGLMGNTENRENDQPPTTTIETPNDKIRRLHGLPPAKNVTGKSNFAKNIPTTNEPMNPLGRITPITSYYGPRQTNIQGASKDHKGIDLATQSGSPVYAPLDGVVMSSKDTTPNSCGGFIQLGHATMETKFCHLRQLIVKRGDNVKKGQLIGYSGGGSNDPMRGDASGPHLHYEILGRSGMPKNPLSVQNNLTA